MLYLALRDIEGRPYGCLSGDSAATLAGRRRTYLIGLITDLVRPWATVLRRGALCAARDSRSAGNEQADAQKRQDQHSMQVYDHKMADAVPARPVRCRMASAQSSGRSIGGRVCTVSMRPGKAMKNCRKIRQAS